MKILFLSPYPLGKAPSQRLKYEQYYAIIEAEGYEITTSSFVSEKFWSVIYKRGNYVKKIGHTLHGYSRRIKDLFRLRKYDIVYIHLWATPFGFPLFEWVIRKLSKKIIYDIDDLIYLNNESNNNGIISVFKGRKKPFFLMSSAEHVIVCTPMLQAVALKYNSNVTDISSTIDTEAYRPKSTYSIQKKTVLGWSGSHSTSKYLHLLQNVLVQLNEELEFKLLVIGDENFNIEGIEIEAIAWSKEAEIKELSRIDIGLYPLPDEPWVYGKSGLKALQYMALGIPTIASAIGANFRIINHGNSGFLVSTRDEWLSKIKRLMNDEGLRCSIGKEGRQVVEKNYSIKVNAQKYLDILKSV